MHYNDRADLSKCILRVYSKIFPLRMPEVYLISDEVKTGGAWTHPPPVAPESSN